MSWKHKDEWKKVGNGFCVVISRHSVPESDFSRGEGLQRWCIYAYIYPSHPYFPEIDENGPNYQEALCKLPMHCGCSLFKVHRDEELNICSFQAGADYNHLHDDRYTRMDTKEDAADVFYDADDLFEWLESRA